MMKTKSLNLLILIAGMSLFAGCSKDDGVSPDDPNALRTIKLSVEASYSRTINLELKNSNYNVSFPTDLFIDWGDGSTTSSDSHEYSTLGTYNVTIQAKNLKWFGSDRGEIQQIDVKDCNSLVGIDLHDNDLTSLDVSGLTALEYLNCYYNDLSTLNLKGCSALKELDCSSNELTTLDVSGLAALESLDCDSNDLSAEALNQIFKDLPQGKTFEDKYGNTKQSTINIYGNPGKDTCDKSIAEKKGWKIY